MLYTSILAKDDNVTLDKPLFMTNERWFRFDTNKGIYVLTKEATSEAKKSYDEFYKAMDEVYHQHYTISIGEKPSQ